MSDRPPLEAFLKWELRIESPSLTYAAKAATRNVVLAIDIPYPLLKAWYDFIATQKKERGRIRVKSLVEVRFYQVHCQPMIIDKVKEFSYTDLFRNSIPQNCFVISEDQQISCEVEESLRLIATKVHALYGKTKGGNKRME